MRPLAIVVVLVLFSAPVSADTIGIYDSPQNLLCVNSVAPFSVTTVYVIHHYAATGAAASRWKISNSAAMMIPTTWNCGDDINLGDPYTGIGLDYGGCQGTFHELCTLQFLKLQADPVPGCSHLQVEPFPGDAAIMVTDCGDVEKIASGGYFTFDGIPVIFCDDCAVAAETRTWGSVKALYR